MLIQDFDYVHWSELKYRRTKTWNTMEAYIVVDTIQVWILKLVMNEDVYKKSVQQQ